jgi:hypothetical protein
MVTDKEAIVAKVGEFLRWCLALAVMRDCSGCGLKAIFCKPLFLILLVLGLLTVTSSDGDCSEPVCVMPSAAVTGCVKLGGGVPPWYFEGWVCPVDSCPQGYYCSAKALGVPGKCGATAVDIRTAISKGEFKVLAGVFPCELTCNGGKVVDPVSCTCVSPPLFPEGVPDGARRR